MTPINSIIIITALAFSIRAAMTVFFRAQYGNPAYIIPLIHEILFVFPAPFIYYLGMTVQPEGLLVLTTFGWCLQIGLLPLGFYKTHPPIKSTGAICSKYYFRIFYTTCLLYLLGILHQNTTNGLSLVSAISKPDDFLTLANSNATSRYDSTLLISPIYKVGVIASFAAAVLSGAAFPLTKKKFSRILLLALLLVPAILDAGVMAARAGMMMLIIVWISSYYAMLIYTSGFLIRIPLYRILIVSTIFGAGIVSFFVVIQTVRAGVKEVSLYDIFSHLLTWFFGYIPAFCQWVESSAFDSYSGFGVYTFSGIADMIGVQEKRGGMFDMVQIGDNRFSNVFTAYRGLIMDFGLFVSYSSISISGLLLAYCSQKLSKARHPGITYVLLILILSFLGWSFVISIYTYNSVLLGIVIGTAFLLYYSKMKCK